MKKYLKHSWGGFFLFVLFCFVLFLNFWHSSSIHCHQVQIVSDANTTMESSSDFQYSQ